MSMIQSLELTNFRSYSQAQFELSPDVTVVVGPNATGKTNLLEALFVLVCTKSFRTRDHGLVSHGDDFFRIVADTGGTQMALSYGLVNGRWSKQITYDGAKKSLVSHIGRLQATLFEPSDLGLISGPPEGRRRYVDYILCQTDPSYLKTLSLYRRVLRQRNKLLSAFDVGRIKDEIFTWDLKLAELAGDIYNRRLEFLSYLNERAAGIYESVAGEAPEISFHYQPSVPSSSRSASRKTNQAERSLLGVQGADYASAFLAELTRRLTADLAAGFTTIGPHREDFKTKFKNNDITAVASRGETRTVVLVLKLAELQYSFEKTGIKPTLLLDDVFSELDASRRRRLLSAIDDHQTIITTTEADAVKDLHQNYITIETENIHVG